MIKPITIVMMIAGAWCLLPGVSASGNIIASGNTIASGNIITLPDCAERIVAVVNDNRALYSPDLRPLEIDPGLNSSANRHALDMIHRSYFDHISPEGETPHQRIALHHRGILVTSTGENIWFGDRRPDEPDGSQLALRIVNDWMNSPLHRENILSGSFNLLGVSIVVSGDYIYAVQHFAGSRGKITPHLPAMLRRGAALRFSVITSDSSLGSPRKFDLVMPDTERPVCEPVYLKSGHLNSPSGVFRLRLYFLSPNERDWEIYTGPLIRVP